MLAAVLDQARALNLQTKFETLGATEFKTAIHLVRHVVHTWDLTDEDVLKILSKVTDGPHADDVRVLLDSGAIACVLRFLEAEGRPEVPTGCFTPRGRKRSAARTPCPRFQMSGTSGTGTAGTVQQS
jgi:hypothetical protein